MAELFDKCEFANRSLGVKGLYMRDMRQVHEHQGIFITNDKFGSSLGNVQDLLYNLSYFSNYFNE